MAHPWLVNDYVVPNTATEDGEVDANYFQHQPYLTTFNAEQGTHLVSVAAIHYEPFGIYAGTKSAITDLASGDKIAVPNDGSNRARALLLLEAQGLKYHFLVKTVLWKGNIWASLVAQWLRIHLPVQGTW